VYRLSLFCLHHRYHGSIGPYFFGANDTAGKGDNPIHPASRGRITDKLEAMPSDHIFQTCPHIFKANSAVAAIVYCYFFHLHFP